MYRRASALITRKVFKLRGVTIAKNTTLSKAQVAALGARIEGLTSNGTIEASPDTYGRRGVHGPRPTTVLPGLRPATTVTFTPDGTTEKKRNFVARPHDAYVFDFDDGNNAVADADGVVSHTYAAAGVYDVTATADYQVGTVQVVITHLATTKEANVVTAVATPETYGPYTFDFGDETPLVVDADGVAVHTYTVPGTYTITATNAHQVSSASVTIAP
jgi:plastocyanin